MADPTLADIEAAERELAELAGSLETLVNGDDEYLTSVLALGHRARSLFLGFIHAYEGPAPVSAMSLLRPGVEINLLLRFLEEDPSAHVKLWIGEGQRQILAFVTDFETDAYLQERWSHVTFDAAFKDALNRDVDEVRREARDAGLAGVGKKGPLLPTAKAIVELLSDPGAKEAYTMAYRSLGSDIHAGTFAFREGTFLRRPDGRVSYEEPKAPESFRAARVLSLTMFASTLCIVSSVLELGVEEEADEIKRRYVLDDPIRQRMSGGSQEGSTVS